MADHSNAYRMAAALAMSTTIVYFGIPAFMSNSVRAAWVDQFILHPAQPLVTGLAFGVSIGILAALTYGFYAAIKQIV